MIQPTSPYANSGPGLDSLVAARHNLVVKAFGDRLRAGGMAPKAVIGACMHKLAKMIFGVLRSGLPFDPRIAMPRVDVQDGIRPRICEFFTPSLDPEFANLKPEKL
jgi:hypothetical protein